MKRIWLILISALALIGSLATNAPAGAAPSPPPVQHASSGGHRYHPFPAGHEKATLAWLRDNIVGVQIGPNVRTGYGQATITAIVKGCPECDWYRTDLDYTNNQPTSAMRSAAATHARKRRSDFCWPWENFIGSGCAGWNSSYSWDWVGIWGTINGDWHPWDPITTIDHFELCIQGENNPIEFSIFGRAAIARFAAGGEVLKLTPAGVVYALAAGCVAHLFSW